MTKTKLDRPIDQLAYTAEEAARVTGRSHTRIKTAIRNKEIIARRDGRITLIERAELQRWLSEMPVIGGAS
jgi:excisionase family DNA binding protein